MKKGKNTAPLRIALIYALFGTLWIILSDKAVDFFIPASSGRLMLQTIKGWLFVLASASLIYLMFRKDMKVLQESELRFRSMIEHGLDNISLLAADGTLLWESPAIIRTLGYQPDQFKGHNIFELIHPDDMEWVQLQVEGILREPDNVSRGVFRVKHANGSWRWIECVGTNLLHEPSVNALVINYRDITERKEAEEVLRESEERYRSLFENMLEGYAFCKMLFENGEPTDFLYLKTNSSFEKLTGLKNVDGKKVSEVIPGIQKDDPELFKIYGRVALTGEPEWFEIHVSSLKDWYSISVYCPMKEYFVAVFDVITERKQAENALREKEVQYRNLADSGTALIWTSGTDKLCNYFNMPWLKFTGRTLEQETGNGWTEGVHPDDFDRCLETYITAFDKRESFDMEYRLRHVSGEYRWLQDLGTPNYDSNGKFIGYIGHCFDITERKHAEEQLQLLKVSVDVALDGAYWMDMEGHFLYVNDAGCKALGYTREEMLQMSIQEINPRANAERWNQVIQNLKENMTSTIESIHRRKDGSEFPVELTSAYVKFGEQEYCNGFAKDITERKQAEKTIREYAADLEQRVEQRTAELVHANRAKDEFLANMSHELRTPLNSILGFSETLLEGVRGPLNERQEQGVKIIHSSGEHLLGLINDILDVSKIEAGKFELHPETVSVNDICHSSLNFVKQLAKKKSITVEYSSPPDSPSILVDPKRLKQILVNLLNNAVKFTPENGNITLKVQADAGRDQMRFSITDTGIGIAPDDLPKLFKPFVQLDSSLSRQYEGSGLGLMLAQKLVDMHGGSIQVESAVGRGSTFTVVLPHKQNTDSINAGDLLFGEVQQEDKSASQSVTGTKILLAEDNETNVMVIRDYLEAYGYQVSVAYDGVEALALAKEVSPALILMDVQMPQMDGLEAIRRLRATPGFATIPIIALTSFAMSGDRERCLEAGASEYLSKPVQLKLLLQFIEELTVRPHSS
jgi:PAS domain S-box-containing protein